MEGGITAYGRWIKEQKDKHKSLFKGRNFTFDKRMGEPITDQVLGKCHICGEPCNRYQNCSHASCNLLMLCCSKCASRFLNTCGRLQCYDVVHDFKSQTSHYFNPDGPVIIDGVRAFIKQGESPEQDRIVIGKTGVKCEHDYHRRVRASDVLGEPGDVLKQWEAAGRELPPLSTEESI